LLVSPNVVFPLLYLGLVASIGGFFFVNYALSKLPAHVSSIYTNLSTIVAILAGAIILNEQMYYYHYIGSLMILIGVYGTVIINQRSKELSDKKDTLTLKSHKPQQQI
jgi:drug/metabolite transporter (DMT)-like permease